MKSRGATPFSVYNTSTPEQAAYVIGDAACRVVFTEQEFLDTVLAARDSVDDLAHVVVIDGEPRGGAISLDELERGGSKDFDLEAAWRAVQPDDTLTLIYTSGTTGPPKGVMLSHRNVVWTAAQVASFFELGGEDSVISYLPLSHIAEQPVSNLSHGQQRQLELGMALAGAPRLILFDEPAAGLSPAERRELVQLLEALPAHIGFILIEHDLEIALRVVERVTVLHNGRLLKEGTPDEIEGDAEVQAIYMGGSH